ncbi:hypothetical protein IW140_003015 [Coemansia sp. RSA 1813]|nr:hypothetical protein EV178_001234 [Coemansia sp. RSA 1646]KAJ1772587.1 hypothetical protein LPJ74_001303 [Coemansia sp. RSA 1843]KAJ2091442.1 hypothetical protein IW138_001901 [Coemansia sp. RSA 986]KAJ2213893.1 hypothetical protein EV179_003477 [Coemansia sp. RSA 487]KAJ2569607.1 hypothetical protein IW140_003015 [Coemansia sp. RSA 1813]
MRFFVAVIATISAAAASVHGLPVRPTGSSPTLHIFGDSLSDIGTLKEMTLGLVPPTPYWDGRFSSGPVWNEYLSLLLDYNLYNRAIGGSTANNNEATIIDILNFHIPSTQDQINYFKFLHPLYTLDTTRNKDIAVLEVGANDFFADQGSIANGTLSVDSFIDTLSTAVVDQLDQLRNVGFKNIIVTNLAAIQYTPMARTGNGVAMATSAVTGYNSMLATKANAWAKINSDITFAISDIGGFVEVTVKSAAVISALGLTDTTDACTDSLNASSFDALFSTAINGITACADPSTSYFFDAVHPAERVHRLFGYYSWKAISALLSGSTYELNEANLLSLIKTYKLGTVAPKPAAI